MTDLTQETLNAVIAEIKDKGELMAIRPTKVTYRPADLKAIVLAHEDVLKMIKEQNA